jgi:hypothetical protein
MKHILYLLFGIILISAATSVYYPLTVDNTLVYDESTNSLRIDTTKIATRYYSGSLTGGGASYLVYTAIINQTGSSAPVANVLENTLGGTVVWSRNTAGDYACTLSGAFTSGKTTIHPEPVGLYVSNLGIPIYGGLTDVNSCALYTPSGNDFDADGITNLFFEIRVYP